MELESQPSLPHAHQQIRLGDNHASSHRWLIAIEHYIRAIEHFKAIQNTLHDKSLISIIQAQIVQCEKTINLCHLKDRSEQAVKAQQAECLSKMTRAHSTSNLKPPTKPNRMMTRHNTLQNTDMLGGHGGVDSFAAGIFPKTATKSNETSPIQAKKNKKHDSHKIEELQTSNDALKTHLEEAMDCIERLKNENNQLRTQQDGQNQSGIFTNSDDEDLEDTL